MNLKPLGDRLIVRAVEEEQTTTSGIVLPDTAKEKPQKGEVLAVGDGNRDEKGERIPLESRIIFACDAFHAMTSDRPYRKALPGDEALRRLAEAAGSQFDPRVVEVCTRVLEAPPAE